MLNLRSVLTACILVSITVCSSISGLYAQNVGIGTNAPQNRLHIDGAAPVNANSGQLRISESTNGRYMLLGRAASYGFIQTHNSQPLAINPLGNNVGIGTTTPNARLHVLHPVGSNWLTNSIFDGGNNAPKLHIAIHSDGTHNNVPAYLTLGGSGGGMGWREYITNWGYGYYWSIGSAAGEKVLARLATLGSGVAGGTQVGSFSLFTATDAQTAGTNPIPAVGTEQVRLTASGNSWLVGGNVGIGTTAPTERLHVAGNLRLDNAFMPGNDAGTAGSLLRSAGAGNAPVWIAPGANGSVLTISGGLPTWSSPNGLFWGLTGNSGTDPATNFIGTTDAKDLVIRTNNTERVRVTSGGNVGIGTTTPALRMDVAGPARVRGGFVITASSNTEGGQIILANGGDYTAIGENCNTWSIDVYSPSTGERFRIFRGSASCSNGAEIFNITATNRVGIMTNAPTHTLSVNGDASKVGGGAWANFSDARLKTDIQPFTDGLNVIEKIRPVSFRYNGKAGILAKGTYVGVLAQEIRAVAPYMVQESSIKIDPSDEEGILMYDPNALWYISVNAIKELKRENEMLLERIKTLEAQMTVLMNELNAMRQSTSISSR